MLRKGWHSLINNFRTLDLFYLFAGIAVFAYALLRAVFIPPYSDEIRTFRWYVQTGSFQPFYSVLEANNHVINSLFSHLFFLLLGDSLFVLRLANVLCFLIYIFYVWKIQKFFSAKFIGFCCSLTLILTPYLLEFFSLARGYGMSMAFLLGSIYYMLGYNSTGRSKSLWGGIFMISLALWSNLALMITAIIIGGLFIILFLKNSFRQRINKDIIINIVVIVCLFIIPLYYAVEFSLLLKDTGHLYHGSSDSFINSVVLNLTGEFSEFYKYGDKIFYFLFTVYVIAGIYALFFRSAKWNFLFIQLLLWGTIAGTIFLHLKMDVKYPQDRTAIHFFVLFVLAFFFALDGAGFKFKFFFSSVGALVFIIQFIKTANLNYAPVWRHETVPVSVYNYLLRWQNQTGIVPIVSAHGLLGKVIDYYDYQNGTKINTVEEKDFPAKGADFIITNTWNTVDLSAEYDTVLKETYVALMKRRKKFTRWESVQVIHCDSLNGSDDFFSVPEIPAGQFPGAPFCYDISFKAQSNRFPFICFLVTELRDAAGNITSYRSLDLQGVKPDIRKTADIYRRQYFEMMPLNTKIIRVYFWNLKKRNINISDLKITLFKGKTP